MICGIHTVQPVVFMGPIFCGFCGLRLNVRNLTSKVHSGCGQPGDEL